MAKKKTGYILIPKFWEEYGDTDPSNFTLDKIDSSVYNVYFLACKGFLQDIGRYSKIFKVTYEVEEIPVYNPLVDINPELLKSKIKDVLNLSTRAAKIFDNLNITTIEELMNEHSANEIKHAENCGKKTFEEIKIALGKLGIKSLQSFETKHKDYDEDVEFWVYDPSVIKFYEEKEKKKHESRNKKL